MDHDRSSALSEEPAAPASWLARARQVWSDPPFAAGVTLLIVSAFSWSCLGFLSVDLHVRGGLAIFQIVGTQGVLMFPVCVVWSWVAKEPLFGPPDWRLRGLLVLRAGSSFVAVSGAYVSFAFLTLADATSLILTAPLWTAVAARLFLGERLTKWHGISAVFSVAGVLLVTRPPFLFGYAPIEGGANGGSSATSASMVLGVIATAVTAAAYATSYVAIRAARKASLLAMTAFISLTFSLGFPIAYIFEELRLPSSAADAVLNVAMTALQLVGLSTLFKGMIPVPATPAALVSNTELCWSFVFGVLMLGNVEAWTAWAGAGLVMVSSVLVAMNGKGSSGKDKGAAKPLRKKRRRRCGPCCGGGNYAELSMDDADEEEGKAREEREGDEELVELAAAGVSSESSASQSVV